MGIISGSWLSSMGLRSIELLAIGLPTSLLLATTALAEERVFDKTFAVTPGGVLTVDTDSGAIKVSGTDRNEVSVHAVIHGSRSLTEKFEITADSNNEGVSVIGRRPKWLGMSWSFGSEDIQYTIQIPRNYHVEVRTSGGNLELRDFNGRAHCRTSGGNVSIGTINGDVQIQTSGGNIRGTQLIGDVRAGTSGGTIKFDNVHGSVEVNTSGGDIELAAIEGKLLAKTSGGHVEAKLTGDNKGVDLRSSGGDITIVVPKQFAATLEAHTSGGDVACDLPVTVTSTHGKHSGDLNGAINGGGNTLTLRTSGGDIDIRASL
jgi:DUF4097 and DUF4098 domain-containing protein YvlB